MSIYMRLRGPAAEDMPYGATGRPHCQIEDFGPVTEAEKRPHGHAAPPRAAARAAHG